jgi:hypothetical protein
MGFLNIQSSVDLIQHKSRRTLPLCTNRQFRGTRDDPGYEEVLTVDDNTGVYALMLNGGTGDLPAVITDRALR